MQKLLSVGVHTFCISCTSWHQPWMAEGPWESLVGLHKGEWEEEVVGVEGTSIELRLALCPVAHLLGKKSVQKTLITLFSKINLRNPIKQLLSI